MSVALTEAAVRERRKTVTRRLGWWEDSKGRRILKVGDKLTLCPKVMGRRSGDTVEPLDRIVEVTVVNIWRERLREIDSAEVIREGFADKVTELGPLAARDWFVEFFCEHMGCAPDAMVTRIEWAYLDERVVTAHDGPVGAEVRQLFASTDTPPPARPPGYLGLHWQAVYTPDSRRWEIQAFPPDSTVPHTRLRVVHVLASAGVEEIARVVAQALNDLGEGAGSLMAASLMQEGERP